MEVYHNTINALYLYDDDKPLRCQKYLIWNNGNPICTNDDYYTISTDKYKIYPGLSNGGYCFKPCAANGECSGKYKAVSKKPKGSAKGCKNN